MNKKLVLLSMLTILVGCENPHNDKVNDEATPREKKIDEQVGQQIEDLERK